MTQFTAGHLRAMSEWLTDTEEKVVDTGTNQQGRSHPVHQDRINQGEAVIEIEKWGSRYCQVMQHAQLIESL